MGRTRIFRLKSSMADLPFHLSIKVPEGGTESITCNALLRSIPSVREIYDGWWKDSEVIVKVFLNRLHGRRHLAREWRGTKTLRERGLNSPEPLFYGRTNTGHCAIIMEKITDSLTALEAIAEASSSSEKLKILIKVCRELARQNSKGILQKDLHLGNFLLKGDTVYALDTGQMQILRRGAGKKRSISQLARLACFLQDNETESISKLCMEYASIRGWAFDEPDEKLFQKQLISQRKRGVRRGLRKCLRTSGGYLRIKTDVCTAVFDKFFCEGIELIDFINQIDLLMDKGQILKRGNTCYVSRVKLNSIDVVVKRYNHKGLIHSIRQTIKSCRGKRCWLNAHRLGMLGISTPKPLAYIEVRQGPIVWSSYLITEYVGGQKLSEFLRDIKIGDERRRIVINQLKEFLARLWGYRITHGDLKHTNILVSEKGPVLTDLDGTKVHKTKLLYRINHAKDKNLLEFYERG